jgi:uncharacterized protein (DUF1786 family)
MERASGNAERIIDKVLSANDNILAISIMDMGGNPLAAKSKESFKKAFGVTANQRDYGGTLALAVLSLVNQVSNIFGEAQAIITIHKNCKLMLLPIPSYQILVGLVLERSVNAEDRYIANKIERLIADMLNRNSNV